jgi:hypothetical protein
MSSGSLRIAAGLIAVVGGAALTLADHSNRSNSDLIKMYVFTVFFGSIAVLGPAPVDRLLAATHGVKSQERPPEKSDEPVA